MVYPDITPFSSHLLGAVHCSVAKLCDILDTLKLAGCPGAAKKEQITKDVINITRSYLR